MPGYMLHFSACNGEALKNRSFVVGVEAPDLLKKHFKVCGGIDGARAKYYDTLKTADMPDYSELEKRVQQKERKGSTEGLHYGLSSSPDVRLFWKGLSSEQQKMLFYRGYAWHLLTDAIMYARLDIDSKFQKALEAWGEQNQEEFINNERQKLHDDWNKTNALVRDTYKGIDLPAEVEELGVVKFIDEGELVYVDWNILKGTIDYLRTFDPINGDMDEMIEAVLGNI